MQILLIIIGLFLTSLLGLGSYLILIVINLKKLELEEKKEYYRGYITPIESVLETHHNHMGD